MCCDILASLNSVLGDNDCISPKLIVITAISWEWIVATAAVLGAVLLTAIRKFQRSPKGFC